jgi:translocation and assembly module TamB
LNAALNLTTNQSAANVEGRLEWLTNEVDLTAEFGTAGWLPTAASVKSKPLHVPAQSVGLSGYNELTGLLVANWTNGNFQIDLTAQAEPSGKDAEALFPVEAAVHASGNTNQLRIGQATISTPFLQAQLSNEVVIEFPRRLLTEEATLRLSSDLARQPWFPASGLCEGDLVLRPGPGRLPDARIRALGKELEISRFRAKALAVEGRLRWPQLEIERAEVELPEGARGVLLGSIDLDTQSVSHGILHVDGRIGASLFPPNAACQRAVLEASFSGPLHQLRYEAGGRIEGLVIGNCAPLGLRADGSGRGPEVDRCRIAVTSGDAELRLHGMGSGDKNRVRVRFDELGLTKGRQSLYQLEQPCALSLEREPNPASRRGPKWLLEVGPLLWKGPGRSVMLEGDLAWPDRGQLAISAHNLQASALAGFFPTNLPSFSIEEMDLAGGWTNGPADLGLDLAGEYRTKDGAPLAARMKIGVDGRGLSLDTLVVASRSRTVLSGKGHCALVIDPANSANPVLFDKQRPVDLHLATVPDPQFWREVSNWIGMGLVDPRVQLDVSGPLASPTGRLTAYVRELHPELVSSNGPLPRLEQLSAEMEVSKNVLRLNSLRMLAEGQAVQAYGQVPMGTNLAANWRNFFPWAQATGRVSMARAELAPWSRFLPRVLSPQGVLSLELALRPDAQIDGKVAIRNAATRPLSPLGPVQGLETDMSVSGRMVTVEKLSGLVGGQPFDLSGTMDFAHWSLATGMPRLNLKLRGSDLPLAREPDLIIRSDLNLDISTRSNNQAVVSGSVHLRDSVFLSDLKVLIPSKAAQPKRRPPYFSIDTPPLADWGIDLHVFGEKFLKVRTPFFRGEISTDLKLEGSLKEPMALGELNVRSGLVDFPFATLEVSQGLVSFTSANPYSPQLFVTAASKVLGYDVRMEVSGQADSPNIQFSSTPPLSSEELLLMVTTGEVPQSETPVTPQQRVSRLAVFLGKSLLSEFTSGSDNADRLTVRSGEYMTDQGQQTYSVEYKLSRDWSIVGEYDRFGAFNAGVKWRIYAH